MKELINLAESVRTQLNLEYDADSVKFIEGFIERNKNSFDKEQSSGLINSLGSFLGQCIINNYGGQWRVDNETGSVAVVFDDNNIAYPFAKVSKQFDNGLEDSVYSFYSVIPSIFKLDKKKKPWWKF
ncbi:MAG: hypothetical protein ACRDEB_03745 [Chitinophagaceae bacterium]